MCQSTEQSNNGSHPPVDDSEHKEDKGEVAVKLRFGHKLGLVLQDVDSRGLEQVNHCGIELVQINL